MHEDREFLEIEDAIALMDVNAGRVHTFRSGGPALLGAEWEESKLIAWMRERKIEKSGDVATEMRHGIVGHDDHGPLFIATKEEESNA